MINNRKTSLKNFAAKYEPQVIKDIEDHAKEILAMLQSEQADSLEGHFFAIRDALNVYRLFEERKLKASEYKKLLKNYLKAKEQELKTLNDNQQLLCSLLFISTKETEDIISKIKFKLSIFENSSDLGGPAKDYLLTNVIIELLLVWFHTKNCLAVSYELVNWIKIAINKIHETQSDEALEKRIRRIIKDNNHLQECVKLQLCP